MLEGDHTRGPRTREPRLGEDAGLGTPGKEAVGHSGNRRPALGWDAVGGELGKERELGRQLPP